MATPSEIRSMVENYVQMMCDSDIDGIISLFAADAVVEDPVGADPQSGVSNIRAFYAATAPFIQVEMTGPICVAGSSVAFPLTAELSFSEEPGYLDAIDVFELNESGQIQSMKAYWDSNEIRQQR